MDVERAQQITDHDLTFDIIRVKHVRRGSPGEQAGLAAGDEIIAVDGRVFASLAAFAGYVGSLPSGSQATVDYMPAHGGPAQAQGVIATLAAPGQPMSASSDAARAPGMSTGAKVAIGVGAVALFGCYETGCLSHRRDNPQTPANAPMPRGQLYSSPTQTSVRP
jgi:hypothetical protein